MDTNRSSVPLTEEQKAKWSAILSEYHEEKATWFYSTKIITMLTQHFNNNSTIDIIYNCVKGYQWTANRLSATDKAVAKTIALLCFPDSAVNDDMLKQIKNLSAKKQFPNLQASPIVIRQAFEKQDCPAISEHDKQIQELAKIWKNKVVSGVQLKDFTETIHAWPNAVKILTNYWIKSDIILTNPTANPLLDPEDLAMVLSIKKPEERENVCAALRELKLAGCLNPDNREKIRKSPSFARDTANELIERERKDEMQPDSWDNRLNSFTARTNCLFLPPQPSKRDKQGSHNNHDGRRNP